MKRTWIYILILPLFLLLVPMANAQEMQDWRVEQFNSDITINQDSSILVKEAIYADFNIEKHGVYRNIPIKYENQYGDNLKIILDVLNVIDENGVVYQYETYTEGNDLVIKIGSPDFTITGKYTYIIIYKVQRVINYFDTWDELYWNATGTNWEVPIEKSSAKIHLPQAVNKDQIQTKCFTGEYGSTEQNCVINNLDEKTVEYEAEGYLTTVLGWPKGLVSEPTKWQKLAWYIHDNGILALPILVFIAFFMLWYKKGKDPSGSKVIVAQFDSPDKIAPAEMGNLYFQKFKNSFLSATIIDLAVRGYLKIKEENIKGTFTDSKSYTLIKLKETDSKLKNFELKIFNGIFENGKKEVKLSDLADKFYKNLSKISSDIFDNLKKLGYYDQNPSLVRWMYISISLAILFFGLFIIGEFGLMYIIAFVLSGLIIFIFALIMPKRTAKGVSAYEYAEGFKLFINTAEKYRLKWQEKENIFETVLPYAMVFGIADKWAQALKDIYKKQPDWYEGQGSFNTIAFTSSMNSFSHSAQGAMSSTPSQSSGFSGGHSGFGGGGFSGGGGGGGGGGSW